MAIYAGETECEVIYVARNGQQLRVSSVWVGDQQVFPPANRQEIHVFTRNTQGYSRYDYGTHFGFTVPVPWWAASMDVVILGAGEKGRDGTKSFSGGSDGAGGRSGAWVVKTIALDQSSDAVVYLGKGTSTSPHATEIILSGLEGQAYVRAHDGEGTRTANNGSTGGSVTPASINEFAARNAGGSGGSRNNPGKHPGGGGGGGLGSNLLGSPTAGREGGDGTVWLRFRSAPAIILGVILRVGVASGPAFEPVYAWAVSIGKTYQTITEITVPMEVVGPSLQALFYECDALESAPEMDTSQVTDMSYMFYGCHALSSVPDMDTSQVTNMRSMFYDCHALTTIPALDTSNVTEMRYMFWRCASLTSIPDLDTSQVTNMLEMFRGCSSLTTVPALNTGQVTDTSFMFEGCSSLTTVPALNTGQVTNMRAMFQYCYALESAPEMVTSQVTDMSYMFFDCTKLASVPETNASQVTNIAYMFHKCSSLESVTLPGMGNGFTTNQTLDMRATKLNAAAANALMQSLGTPPPGGNLQLPSTAKGANTSIATAKNWKVTVG